MAKDLDINVKINAELDRASSDIKKLQSAGAFKGEGGIKALNKIQSVFTQLQNTDLSKLKGTQLTDFLNNLSKLRHYLDTAGRSLTNYSDEYSKQLKKVEAATLAVSKAQDKQTTALDKQKESLKNLDLKSRGYSYYNKENNRPVSRAETIADLYNAGNLRIVNKQGTEITGGAYDATVAKMGLKDYAESRQEVNNATITVDQATLNLKNEQKQLDKTPMGSSIHPVTAEVATNSAATAGVITDIKTSVNEAKKEDIDQTTNAIDLQTASINKQSTSLGRAFKQFTLYAIALRTIKKALREAVKTVKELDRALTEQAMVTGLTRKQTYGLLQSYQDMASRLGTTTKEVSSTMTQFLRQGRSISESLKLTEAAVSAAKVAGISAADSINYLTTAINGFRLSADDAMKVSDKFAAVAASAATSYEEIAIALSKVAAQANLAGMSIDYTTALLTKGIETTREAPETIGTALKTVIARMREMTDYGETLEGDTNINNVETQLAYIGIQLRENSGELRSTEDVLNDLGQQWDSLNANQQAAIAKALAGTRQQSRLIAMMQDYERVIELQEIAEQSQGATMAQMATYLEGMDAALNKVNVAWETVVSNIVNNDAVIGFINLIGGIIETIANNLWLLIPAAIILVAQGTQILNQRIREAELTRIQLQNAKESNKIANKEKLANAQKVRDAQKELVIQLKTEQSKLNALKSEGKLTAEDEARLKELEEQIPLENAKIKIFDQQVEYYEKEAKLLDAQTSSVADLSSKLGGLGTAFGNVFMSAIPGLMSLVAQTKAAILAEKQYSAQLDVDTAKAKESGTSNAANSAAKIPYVGWIIWAVIMGSAIITAVWGAIKTFNGLLGNSADTINDMSKNIYDLNKKATGLETTISKFDALDNKILKTSKDLEEMHTLLESASDSLSDEEKEQYEKLQTDIGRRNFLQETQEKTIRELRNTRNNQRNRLLNRGTNFLTSTNAKDLQNIDAMYALNNVAMYEYVNSLTTLTEEQKSSVRKITQSVLESVSKQKAFSILGNQGQINAYVNNLASNVDAVSILQSDDKTIQERVDAFKKLYDSIKLLGDDAITNAFKTLNKEWLTFSNLNKSTLEYIDKLGADINGINDLAEAIQKTGVSSEKSAEMIDLMFTKLQQGADLRNTITDLFGSQNYKSILDAYDKAFGITILNMGQNVDKFKNTIDSFYKTAGEWSGMSETDKTSFLSENAKLFEGIHGQELLNAFESGNYAMIASALGVNEALAIQREQLIKEVNEQIKIELARDAEEINYAYIQELQEYRDFLEDTERVYLASLKTRYEQQQAQIDAYKEFLQKENDALTESLEKRKEAYQKYFDAINQQAEDEEYEEKVQTLIANISKLSSSTNADAMVKTADLTKQLEELEKERLNTLRERTQEAIIQNIDDTIQKMSNDLEKLLANEQALLTAMTNGTNNPSEFIASLVSAQVASGNNTELGVQSYLAQMQSTFASIMPGVDWSNVDVERQGDNLILNILGKEVVLSDSEQQTIYDAIQSALRQLGYN